MTEDKPVLINKELTLEKAEVLRKYCSRDGKNLIVWQIVKINELKVTFVAFSSPLFNHLEKDGKVSVQNYERIGDSMTLKVDKDIIDKVINHYGDIVANLYHRDGVVKIVLTFEEIALNSTSISELDDFMEMWEEGGE